MRNQSPFKNLQKNSIRTCANIHCDEKFPFSGKKRFCSEKCKKQQHRIDVAEKRENPDAVALPKVKTCALPKCNALVGHASTYCCDAHRKTAWQLANKPKVQASDKNRTEAYIKFALTAAEAYYTLDNVDDRTRLIESLLEIALDLENKNCSKVRRMMRSPILLKANEKNPNLFFENNPAKYYTMTQIITNYLVNYYGAFPKDFIKIGGFNNVQVISYNSKIDTKADGMNAPVVQAASPFGDKSDDELFDDEVTIDTPAVEENPAKNVVNPVVYENIEKSIKRWEW